MLSKAALKFQASAPPLQPAKADLAKQLFPSSSPSTQDGDIAGWASKRGLGGTTSSASSATLKAAGSYPLNPRSSNPMPPPNNHRVPSRPSITGYAQPTNRLESLCNKSDSFKDVPSSVAAGSQAKPISTVYISDGDFSDDDNLELDYECPASLPVPPPPRAVSTPTARRIHTASDAALRFTPQSNSIPWSSSPAEHLVPPQSRPPVFRQPSLKRASPEEALPKLPPAKKRTIPKNWKTNIEDPIDVDEPVASGPHSVATPATKPKGSLWDQSYSATKEKKKQLKIQNKRSDPRVDDVRAGGDSHTKSKKASAISLSLEQQHVIDLVVQQKQSVFFTGPAGTGKSVLMRAIIAEMKKKWARDPERLSVTASTGLAACNIGGMTLHSFAGIGLGKEDVPTLVKKIRRNGKAKNRWLRTSTLIIDEVSMVDGELFDKLQQIARTIRNNGRAWGGIQLVITGDFFQLPPVPDGDKKRETKFAFEAATWNTSIDHTIGLTQVFRQRDPEFANMLNEMRLGRISDETVQTFKALSKPLNFDDGLDVTELFPTRQEVERSNEMRLRNLPGTLQRFESADSGDPSIRDRLLQNMMAPKSIDLKKGAQVMLIKNLDDTLVNGSLGKVRGFMNEATFELWTGRQEDGDSGDEADADGTSKKKIKAYSRDPDSTKDLKEYPVVQFTGTDGTHRTMLMLPEDWKVELPNGEVQAQRRQLPLILAWALSIHKAQGQTLERVKVDLGKVFEKGQAYVALSRATSKQGLQVLRFDKNKVMAHPRVIQFYNKLYSAEAALKVKKTSTSISMSEFAFKGKSASVARGGVEVVELDDEEEAMSAYG